MHASQDTPAPEPREIQLPAGLLHDLRATAGPDALESAGRGAGSWLVWNLREVLGAPELSEVPSHAFWDALDQILRSRGWGRLRQERVHSGLGVIVAEEWIECGDSDSGPGCPFTTGLLSEVFGAVAGHSISVVETSCEGHGDDTCRFAFGSDTAVGELRGRLGQGLSEEAALAGF